MILRQLQYIIHEYETSAPHVKTHIENPTPTHVHINTNYVAVVF